VSLLAFGQLLSKMLLVKASVSRTGQFDNLFPDSGIDHIGWLAPPITMG
jgi:hypothetical protein